MPKVTRYDATPMVAAPADPCSTCGNRRFSHMASAVLGRERSISALEEAMREDRSKEVLLRRHRRAVSTIRSRRHLHGGTVATIIHMLRLPSVR